MEMNVDFSIAARYGEQHDLFSQGLKVFRSFIRVLDLFFKKEKYQHAEIKIDGSAKHEAMVGFCGKKYRISLVVDPTEPRAAMILLAKMNRNEAVRIGTAVVADPGSVIFPGDHRVLLKDEYEFIQAVLKFFIDGIGGVPEQASTVRQPAGR
ncbi:MAG: hypothetical protein JXI33_07545 [Candidatus Aminicenantes bacterium]|nr:hypothetical protein [Candidatus Aminicenantes bacterium]